ncbi:MAG: hypothetical protein GC161_09765 [Planctomycetaceae bacterium]|nr:hypothetical protein [Planctomycetaceae bacterium]
MNHRFSARWALSVGLLVAGLVAAACGPKENREDSDLRLLWTGACLGFVEPCGCSAGRIGGLDRMAEYVRSELARHPAALFVDTGDLFLRRHRHPQDDAGSPFPAQQDPLKAEAFLRTLGDLGIAAMGVGDLDLAIGHETLKELAARHGVPLVNANIVDAGGALVFEPYAIVERGGRRIGIFSLLADRLDSDEVEDKRPVDVARVLRSQGLSLTNWLHRATAVVGELRGTHKVDLVFCASHLGAARNRSLVEAVEGIDIVFGPHTEKRTTAVDWVEGTPVLAGSVRGARVGTVDWWWPEPDKYFGKPRPGPLHEVSDHIWLAFESEVHASDFHWLEGRAAVLGNEEHSTRRQTAERGMATVERMLEERGPLPEGNRFSSMLIPLHAGIGRDEHALASVDLYHQALHDHWTADPPASRHPTERFAGPEACDTCHPAQTEFWRGTRHARAFETLRATQQHVDLECIGCHTVGLHLPGGFRHPAASAGFENVQCGNCHGPEGPHLAGGASYLDPDVFRPPLQSCAHCHNKEHDPTFMTRAATMIPLVSCPPLEPPGRGSFALRASLLEGARALEAEPRPDWSRISDAYYRAGDLDQAVRAAETWVDRAGYDVRALVRLGQRKVERNDAERGDAEHALELADRVVDAQPNNPFGWQVRAVAVGLLGDADEALRSALEAHSLRPQDGQGAAILAQCYVNLGRRLDAVTTLRKHIEAYPANAPLLAPMLASIQ